MAAAAALFLTAFLPGAALAGYTEGMECFKQKDWGCVIAQFETEVESHPEYDFGWFMIGVSHLQKKEYSAAVEKLNKAIEINDGKLGYHVNKAKAFTDQEQYDKVIATLSGREALEGTQGEVFSLNYQLGTAYHQTKKHKEAIPYLEKSAAVKDDFTTLYMLGISYDQVGNTDKSLSTLKAALKQKPGDGDVQNHLANTYLNLAGRERNKDKKAQFYTEAVKYGQGAVKAQANDTTKQNTLARAYLGAKQYDQAEASFKKVLSLDPSYCFAKTNLGKVYIAKKQWNSAIPILSEATQCMSDSDVAWESLGFAQEKIYKDMATDRAKIAQLEKALASFQAAAKISDRSSILASIDRVKQNIDIARQNDSIARKNIETMETNLTNLKRGKAEAEKALAEALKQRQFFLDKGSWTDEQEKEFQTQKANIERDMANYDKQIADQETELSQAKAALTA